MSYDYSTNNTQRLAQKNKNPINISNLKSTILPQKFNNNAYNFDLNED